MHSFIVIMQFNMYGLPLDYKYYYDYKINNNNKEMIIFIIMIIK